MTTHHDRIEALSKKLEEWDYKIDRLQHRAQDLPIELKGKAEQAYQEMVAARDQLREKQKILIDSSEQAYKDIEDSIEGLWRKVKQVFKDAKTELEEKEV